MPAIIPPHQPHDEPGRAWSSPARLPNSIRAALDYMAPNDGWRRKWAPMANGIGQGTAMLVVYGLAYSHAYKFAEDKGVGSQWDGAKLGYEPTLEAKLIGECLRQLCTVPLVTIAEVVMFSYMARAIAQFFSGGVYKADPLQVYPPNVIPDYPPPLPYANPPLLPANATRGQRKAYKINLACHQIYMKQKRDYDEAIITQTERQPGNPIPVHPIEDQDDHGRTRLTLLMIGDGGTRDQAIHSLQNVPVANSEQQWIFARENYENDPQITGEVLRLRRSLERDQVLREYGSLAIDGAIGQSFGVCDSSAVTYLQFDPVNRKIVGSGGAGIFYGIANNMLRMYGRHTDAVQENLRSVDSLDIKTHVVKGSKWLAGFTDALVHEFHHISESGREGVLPSKTLFEKTRNHLNYLLTFGIATNYGVIAYGVTKVLLHHALKHYEDDKHELSTALQFLIEYLATLAYVHLGNFSVLRKLQHRRNTTENAYFGKAVGVQLMSAFRTLLGLPDREKDHLGNSRSFPKKYLLPFIDPHYESFQEFIASTQHLIHEVPNAIVRGVYTSLTGNDIGADRKRRYAENRQHGLVNPDGSVDLDRDAEPTVYPHMGLPSVLKNTNVESYALPNVVNSPGYQLLIEIEEQRDKLIPDMEIIKTHAEMLRELKSRWPREEEPQSSEDTLNAIRDIISHPGLRSLVDDLPRIMNVEARLNVLERKRDGFIKVIEGKPPVSQEEENRLRDLYMALMSRSGAFAFKDFKEMVLPQYQKSKLDGLVFTPEEFLESIAQKRLQLIKFVHSVINETGKAGFRITQALIDECVKQYDKHTAETDIVDPIGLSMRLIRDYKKTLHKGNDINVLSSADQHMNQQFADSYADQIKTIDRIVNQLKETKSVIVVDNEAFFDAHETLTPAPDASSKEIENQLNAASTEANHERYLFEKPEDFIDFVSSHLSHIGFDKPTIEIEQDNVTIFINDKIFSEHIVEKNINHSELAAVPKLWRDSGRTREGIAAHALMHVLIKHEPLKKDILLAIVRHELVSTKSDGISGTVKAWLKAAGYEITLKVDGNAPSYRVAIAANPIRSSKPQVRSVTLENVADPLNQAKDALLMMMVTSEVILEGVSHHLFERRPVEMKKTQVLRKSQSGMQSHR